MFRGVQRGQSPHVVISSKAPCFPSIQTHCDAVANVVANPKNRLLKRRRSGRSLKHSYSSDVMAREPAEDSLLADNVEL